MPFGARAWLYLPASLFSSLLLPCAAVWAEEKPLDLFVGSWKIEALNLQPERSAISYTEKYEWILDGQYIRGETSRKPDGNLDIVFATQDLKAGGYPFWIFTSDGSYTYLFPAKWDKNKRVMTWKNPSQFDVNYLSQCKFPSKDLRSCFLIMKDWKGKVLSEIKWTATRVTD